MEVNILSKEFEIMKPIWESNNGITYKELCNSLRLENSADTPKATNAHLFNLVKKGFVRIEGSRRKHLYFPQISRQEYDEFLARRTINQLFEGSFQRFVSAFSLSEGLTKQEVLALKELLEQEGE